MYKYYNKVFVICLLITMTDDSTLKTPSRIISKVLSPAAKVWLLRLVSSVDELSVKIEGSDRQILKGYIPKVFLAATRAVYQDLHLTSLQFTGENIRVNLGQILKGKPLELLEPISVSGHLVETELDLQTSLSSSLLSTALTDLLGTLLEAAGTPDVNATLKSYRIEWQSVRIGQAQASDQITLTGTLTDRTGHISPVILRTGLQLASPHQLKLFPLHLEVPIPTGDITEFLIDLGTDVEIEQLAIAPGQLVCQGQLKVIP